MAALSTSRSSFGAMPGMSPLASREPMQIQSIRRCGSPRSIKTDGVGFEPTRRFHVCRFSRSATPLGDSQREQLGKQVRNAPGPSATAPLAFNQDEETEPNRDTTRQIETTHQTSQRQVATCLSRNDSKWRESWRSAQALARLPSGGRDSSPQAGGTVSGKPSPPVLRA